MQEILKYHFSSLLICLLLIFPAWAQLLAQTEPYVLSSTEGQSDSMAGRVHFLEDSGRKLTLQTVQERQESEWRIVKSKTFNKGINKSVFWLRFRVQAEARAAADFFWVVSHPNLYRLELYIPEGAGLFRKVVSGSNIPIEQRQFKKRNLIFPLSEFHAKGRVLTYYLRVETTTVFYIPASLLHRSDLQEKELRELYLFGLFHGILLVMLLYNLFLYFTVRDISYLYYVVFLAAIIHYFLLRDGVTQLYFWPFVPSFLQTPSAWFTMAMFFFYLQFVRVSLDLKRIVPWLNRVFIFLQAMAIFAELIMFYDQHLGLRFIVGPGILGPVAVLTASLICLIKGYRPARYFFLASICFQTGAGLYILFSRELLPLNVFTRYSIQAGLALEVVLFSLGLAERMNSLKREKEQAQAEAFRIKEEHALELENRVKERTHELEISLAEVRKLKEHQDGDYFLTSLLIEPLSRNNTNDAEAVQVSFLTRQKKRFEFRKWRAEIGGDLNAAYCIKLRDKFYTVFLNADAMGKSIQGAGGALVLGAVFRSMIERTRVVDGAGDVSPEVWLRNNFTELQRVFESFDGSMMVSLIMGLVGEDGRVYYVNADHPLTVLLRNDTATFLEDESRILRKLGNSHQFENLIIHTLQLQKGDVIVCGTDGREDILEGYDYDGSPIFMNNESVFPELVLKQQAELERILVDLQGVGDLTDDIALLSVRYLGY